MQTFRQLANLSSAPQSKKRSTAGDLFSHNTGESAHFQPTWHTTTICISDYLPTTSPISDTDNKSLAPVPAILVGAGAVAAFAERVGGDTVELVDAAKKDGKSRHIFPDAEERLRGEELTSYAEPTAWGCSLP
jgi:hypothetical protein